MYGPGCADLARTRWRALTAQEYRREPDRATMGPALEVPFRDVVEASSNGMLLVDGEGRIVFVNPAGEALFRYGRAALLGQPVEILVPEASRRAHPALRRRYQRDPTPLALGAGRDLYGLRKDGSEFPVEIGLTPLETSDGPMVLATVTDITARKLAEEQLASVAHTLQNALLPGQLPRTEVVQLASRYRPGATGTEVGGDWYDAILRDDMLTLVIGDVAGRGIDAAAIMGAVRHALATSAMTGLEPGRVLTHANEYLRSLGPGMVTCLAVRFDLINGVALGASAGHVPLVMLAPGEPAAFAQVDAGPPLGILDNYVYSDAGVDVPPGACLVLYTDGLIERRGEPITAGLARMLDAVSEHSSDDPEALCDRLLDVFGDGIDDDVALLVARFAASVRFSKAATAPFRASIRSDTTELPRLRGDLDAWLAGNGISEWTRFAVVTAVNEAATNSVLHANALSHEPIAVEVTASGSAATAVVEDRGVWRSTPHTSGRGIELMRLLMERVSITTGHEGTTVTLSSGTR